MKKFIFAMCGLFMMSLASLNAQASSVSEPIPTKNVDYSISTPILNDVISITPMDCFVMNFVQLVAFSTVAEIPVMQSRSVVVPKCPFRYLYKSKYCTHYSYTAHSRLITPY